MFTGFCRLASNFELKSRSFRQRDRYIRIDIAALSGRFGHSLLILGR